MEKIKSILEIYNQKTSLEKTVIAVLTSTFIIAIAILVTYFTSTGNLSSDPADWGNFGSLLSGLFTLTGTVAAIATLIAFLFQIQKQGAINKSQLEINTLQYNELLSLQYERHRAWFFETLQEVENFYSNRIEIHSKYALYKKLFPENRPDKPIRKSEPGNKSGLNQDLIDDILGWLEKIERHCKASDLNNYRSATSLLYYILNVSGKLNVNFIGEKELGTVMFDSQKTFINILELDHALGIICKIVNSIIDFGNHNGKAKIEFDINPATHDMVEAFKRTEKLEETFKIHTTENFMKIRDAYLISNEKRCNHNDIEWLYIKTCIYIHEKKKRTPEYESEMLDLIKKEANNSQVDPDIRERLQALI